MANTVFSVANIEFDSIKSNLKSYLSTQTQFKDYDFEGSNLNVLLDVLAWNTYMNNFYLNMVASESFIDSAQIRNSVISHAKTLNYTPRSFSSSAAVIDIQIIPTDTPAQITIPRYTEFTTRVDNTTYTFTTDKGITISAGRDGSYVASNVEIFEGEIITELFVANTANTAQRFVLSNRNVDTNSIVVKVNESSSDTTNTEWVKSTSTIGINGTTNTYYLLPAENERYEIQFGDGVLGRPLKNNNVVEVVYRACAAEEPNGATVFSLSDNIQGYSNVAITLKQRSQGGSIAESIDSIKFNATKSIAIQDRTITTSDYKTLLLQEFPEIEAINVFGGEELSPPKFGRVAISVDLRNADGISNLKKREIEAFVKLRSPLSITPVVIDPEFLYVDVTTNVSYNPSVTTKSENEIAQLVSSAIVTFMANNINDFAKKLRLSKLSAAIDAADPSILSNNTEILLEKRIVPTLNQTASYTLQFDNPIYREVALNGTFVDGTSPIASSEFTFNGVTGCSLRDNGSGVIEVVQQTTEGTNIVSQNIGNVNYSTGVVNIINFAVTQYSGSSIQVTAKPSLRTVNSSKNIILSYTETPIITTTQERL